MRKGDLSRLPEEDSRVLVSFITLIKADTLPAYADKKNNRLVYGAVWLGNAVYW